MPYDRGPNAGGRPHGGHGQARGNYGRDRPEPPGMAEIWPHYLKDGYFAPSDSLNPDYVSREKIALIVNGLQQQLTTGQLRRFFGHCRHIETRLKAMNESWANVRPDFLKIDVAAEDARGKQPPKIPNIFYEFLKLNVAAVRNEKDFLRGFIPHFEALVGFSAGKLKERN